MAFAVFGPGSLYITRTDIANGTPINIGFVQEFSLDEAATVKELFGQNSYPLAIARGTVKVTGKAKAAELSALAVNSVFHGETAFISSQLLGTFAEAHVIPGSPFTVTITPGGSGTFDTDLGVVDKNTGLPYMKVASGPTTGQYSQSGAVYTFAAADTTKNVLISYAFTTSTVPGPQPSLGQSKIVTQKPIGVNPVFQIDYATTFNNLMYYVRIFQCVATKLMQSFKLEDFMMPEVDFGVMQNAAGQIYEVGYPQIG